SAGLSPLGHFSKFQVRYLLPLRSGFSWRPTLSESTGLCAREGSFLPWWTPTPDAVAVARRTVGTAPCPTLDEIGSGQTTPERARTRTNMSGNYDRRSYLRDTS